jgi:predicted permease
MTLNNDFAYAIRQLRKSPGFSLAAVITLALGIGANLTVFLILYGVLLKPLPFPHSERLVRVNRIYPPSTDLSPAYSATKFLFMQSSNRSFESMAAYDYVPGNVSLIQGGEAVPITALRGTTDFFRVFQTEPALGRGFEARDTIPNAAGVAVVSDALWHQRFSADPHVLGRSIQLGNQIYTIVGVARPQFHLDSKVDIWLPLPLVEDPEDHNNTYNVVGRLREGVTYAQATDDLRRVMIRLKETHPALNWEENESIRLVDYQESLVGNMRPALQLLMGAVGLVLVIVAANILSLLLTRSVARRREMSVRAALGASGWRILRQLLIENAVLCAVGGIAGVLVAQVAAPALMRLSPLELPEFSSLQIGVPALVFAAVLTLGCALLFSIVPAVESRRTQLNQSLRVNTTQIAAGRYFAQKALVISEVAISLVLLIGASLLLASFWKLMHAPKGFETDNVLTFKTAFSSDKTDTTAHFSPYIDQLTERIEALPGVASATAAITLPTQLVPDLPFAIIGKAGNRDHIAGDERYLPVTAHYFDTLRVPVYSGRSLSTSDTRTSTPVVVVNRVYAEKYFPGENAVGQHIRIGDTMGPGFEDSVRQIVGVVGDVKQEGLDAEAPGIMYLPISQVPDALTKMDAGLLGTSWAVRMKNGQVNVIDPMRQIFTQGEHVPLLGVQPLSDVISASVAQQRFSMILLSGFGLISLVLGCAGLYGVMSYAVARRTKEIGIRMAIGAQRRDIFLIVLGEAGVLVAVGLAIGLAAALGGVRLLQSLIFGSAPRDPMMMLFASVLLLATGLAAAWFPARRAATTEPMQALRTE